LQALLKRRKTSVMIVSGGGHEHADPSHRFGLLCANN